MSMVIAVLRLKQLLRRLGCLTAAVVLAAGDVQAHRPPPVLRHGEKFSGRRGRRRRARCRAPCAALVQQGPVRAVCTPTFTAGILPAAATACRPVAAAFTWPQWSGR